MQKHERFWSGEKMLKKFTKGMRRETEILYQMYGKAICAIAYKYLRDNELAEDCLQEVMLRLAAILERIGEYGSPEVLRLIYAITRNQAIDIQRAYTRAMGSPQNVEPDEMLVKQSVEDKYFMRGDGISEELHHYLAKLEDVDQQILYLHDCCCVNFSEIAKFLGRSKESVEQRASRARKRLARMILEAEACEGERKS